MKKNPLNLLVIAVLAIFVAFTGCKDYDDDISSLESKIGNLQQALNGIQSKIDGGAVITNVTSDGGGITITLSNGQNYKITNGEDGKNGKDGAAGADGSVITIGDNGNWFIDGVDTELPARGPMARKVPTVLTVPMASITCPTRMGSGTRSIPIPILQPIRPQT